jgi:putative hydrolase of HD superfamily
MRDEDTRLQLNDWVYEKLGRDLTAVSPEFAARFRAYHRSRSPQPEKLVLGAAHALATKWEFDFIYRWSADMYGVEDTAKEIERQASAALKALPLSAAVRREPLWGFVSLVGQLAFQKRWAQTPRIPQTSVLGHLLFVAITAYLISLETGACPRRARNNFFGGLFHDLPEVLTRDIVSPVKTSVEGLENLIRRYERDSMEQRVFPLLPESWRGELRYYTEEEFKNKTVQPGRIDPIQRYAEDIPEEFNRDEFNPLDGQVIEVCDKLAAYIEASVSIRMGLRPQALEEGKRRMYERFSGAVLYGRPVGRLFDLFW